MTRKKKNVESTISKAISKVYVAPEPVAIIDTEETKPFDYILYGDPPFFSQRDYNIIDEEVELARIGKINLLKRQIRRMRYSKNQYLKKYYMNKIIEDYGFGDVEP